MAQIRVMLARQVLPLAIAAVAAAGSAGSVAAQDATVYATASVDGNSDNVELVGGSVRFGQGLGLAPVVGVQAYRVGYETVGGDNRSIWSVNPSAGVNYRMAQGQLEARVGYAFQSEDAAPIIEGVGGKSGLTSAVQGNYWGGGPEVQAIAAMNWRSDYLWTNLQAVVPVMQMNPARLSAGAEVVWQGDVGDNGGSHSFQVGPVLKYATGHNSAITAGAGWKTSDARDDTWYARLAVVRYGIHLGGSR